MSKLKNDDFVVLALTGAEIKLLESALVVMSEDGTQRFDGLDEKLQESVRKTISMLSPIIENGIEEDSDLFRFVPDEPVAQSKLTGLYHWLDDTLEPSTAGFELLEDARAIAFAYSENVKNGGEPSDEIKTLLAKGIHP